MAEHELPGAAQQLLRGQKVALIDALSADPDFVLQHVDSLSLVSHREYQQIKAITDPVNQARDLLDHVIQKSATTAEEFLQLLKSKELQEMFPKLRFLTELPVNDQMASGGQEVIQKRRLKELEILPAKQTCSDGSRMVTEKDLMHVARGIGHSWREIGTGALDIPSVQLEQIQENHPNNHVDRVFAMLRYWSRLKRRGATAACLHSLLSQGDWDLPPDSIDFLLDTS
ncbi:hypothetical protein DPEC_G00013230 [Dallia pectoralis]|uniref:Uncharacterized protein n=1 Tax=Dallia pectoralis TaxID=75939 RepID=A0ACC2HMS2_DALPE|nr:hypothetical protein DPEC_G00013230 [Dallia pectoralis]